MSGGTSQRCESARGAPSPPATKPGAWHQFDGILLLTVGMWPDGHPSPLCPQLLSQALCPQGDVRHNSPHSYTSVLDSTSRISSPACLHRTSALDVFTFRLRKDISFEEFKVVNRALESANTSCCKLCTKRGRRRDRRSCVKDSML